MRGDEKMADKRAINNRVEPKKSLDYYATPAWVTRALLELLPPHWFGKHVWEPAAGGMHMAEVLAERFGVVFASDVYERSAEVALHDFIAPLSGGVWPFTRGKPGKEDLCIITNPPFSMAMDFIQTALHQSNRVAMLGRLALLEGGKRYKELFKDNPPTSVHVFTERIGYLKNGDPKWSDAAGIAANAWFLWDYGERLNSTRLKWIAPCRDTLTKTGGNNESD